LIVNVFKYFWHPLFPLFLDELQMCISLVYQYILSINDFTTGSESKSYLQRRVNADSSFSDIVGLSGLSKKVVLISTLFFRFVDMHNLVFGIFNFFGIVMNVES